MGYLLKEALKTLCGVNQWSYAVFWKIGSQNPKLLIWEDFYCEPITYSGPSHISGIESQEQAFEEWEACWVSGEARTSLPGVQAENKAHSLINKMMMDNHVNLVGEGLIGRAAFTGNHKWILSENYTREAHPPEVLNEMCQQFSAGMQTVAIIPVLPHGVVQLGSSLNIMENMGFVNDVKTFILQIGCVRGSLLSDNYATKEPIPKIGVPSHHGKSVSDSCNEEGNSSQPSRIFGQSSFSLIRQIQDDHCRAKFTPVMTPKLPFESQQENRVTGAEVIPTNPEVWLNQRDSLCIPRSGYGSLRIMEQTILSGDIVRGHVNNSLSASNGSTISQQRIKGGLISSSHKDSVTTPSLEQNGSHNVVADHLISLLSPSSLSNEHRSANNNTFCAQLANIDSLKTETSTSDFADHLTTNHLLSSSSCRKHSTDERCTQIGLAESKEKIENDLFQALSIPLLPPDEHMRFSEHIPGCFQDSQKHGSGYQSPRLKNAKSEDVRVQLESGDDLFDILGVDFKNRPVDRGWNNFLYSGPDTNIQNLDVNNCASIKLHEACSDLYSVNEGNSDSGIFSVSGTDHLLDAVVSRVHSAAKQSSDDNDVSCRTALTNISSSSAPVASPASGRANVSSQMQLELFGLPKSLAKAVAFGSCSFRSGSCKDDAGNFSQTNSIYGSQISSWVEQGHDTKCNSSISTAYSKRPDEITKSNRKRPKHGENPRPRPKDRQMIQDRVKELREIVPNGAKCSIDALFERTIRHMLFLQSVAKHADKLKQTGESKIISKEGGLLLKDNYEGGATWAYEVGSQSMVCPIIVEDLNAPRQMLVEMLCEERGLFLEIADIIRGLGLTILKGVMESRNNKIWARFVVEADRDITRMEIFISLVRVLEETVKSNAASTNCIDNGNAIVHQSFHQACLPDNMMVHQP